MPKKQTRVERYKLRYTAVRNATGDAKLARELRYRSNEYIYNNFGISIPKKQGTLREIPTKAVVKRKQLEIRKFQYARERGIKVKEAILYKRKTFVFIEARAKYYTPEKPKKIIKSKKESRDERIAIWGIWAKNKDFPDFIKKEAQEINKKTFTTGGKSFDKDASYGYTVAFYAFIENESVEKWLKLIEADKVTESAMYRTVRSLK